MFELFGFTVIPLVNKIMPGDIVNIINTLIVYINNNFQAVGFGYQGSVTRRQFFSALAASNLMQTVVTGIPPNANDPVYIQFVAGLTVTPNDSLAQNVQATLGYNSAQMAALFATAAALTP